MSGTLTSLALLSALAGPPAAPISPPGEEAVGLRIDRQSQQATWDVVGLRDTVGRATLSPRLYDLKRKRALKVSSKVSRPSQGLRWTRKPKAPLLSVLGEDGRWHLQVGGKEPASPSAASDLHGAVSPNRKTLAFVSGRSGHGDLYVTPANKSNQSPRRLSSAPTPELRPAWSPDSKSLAFVRLTGRGRQLVLLTGVDKGAGTARVAVDERDGPLAARWRPDGKQLAFFGHDWSVGTSLYTLDPSFGPPTKVLGDVRAQPSGPVWLPDNASGFILIALRRDRFVAVDAMGQQTTLDTGTFGHDELDAAVISGQRTLVFTALGRVDDESADPRYRRVFRWAFPATRVR